ncbi:LysM peptidoglycan-binding domain-containing protein [Nocardioides sp. 616]|uniref:LysM peptidoglycan-binding domain-containing protein n=1 Tax=Nocardioides sp. 616 TaxID=2268090 RepID=UPI0013B368E5|nr:LysM peptidoglycan-binding domain-containing protein [Nocardioides sp. 616]
MVRGHGTDRAPWWRCLLVWLTTTSACGAGAWLCTRTLTEPGDGTASSGFDSLLLAAAALAGVVSLGWIWLVATLASCEAARGRTSARHGGALRRLVLAACGGALLLSSTGPALAHAGDAARPGRHGVPSSVAGLPFPDRATDPRIGVQVEPQHTAQSRGVSAPLASRDPGPPPTDGPGEVRVVRQGDTLWALASERLPGSATPEQVDRAWRAIHRRNREVVGPDPDLIVPGQSLVLPAVGPEDGRS